MADPERRPQDKAHAATPDDVSNVSTAARHVAAPIIDVETMTGLLRLAESRARDSGRAIAAALLAGKPWRWAAMEGGVHPATLDKWTRADPELRQCLSLCEQMGFARTIESELYSVALDRSHRGQIRALELVAKARAPEYRDKHQVEMTVRHTAEQAQAAVTDGWHADNAPSS